MAAAHTDHCNMLTFSFFKNKQQNPFINIRLLRCIKHIFFGRIIVTKGCTVIPAIGTPRFFNMQTCHKVIHKADGVLL